MRCYEEEEEYEEEGLVVPNLSFLSASSRFAGFISCRYTAVIQLCACWLLEYGVVSCLAASSCCFADGAPLLWWQQARGRPERAPFIPLPVMRCLEAPKIGNRLCRSQPFSPGFHLSRPFKSPRKQQPLPPPPYFYYCG